MRMTRLASQDGAIAIMVAVLAMVMFATAAFALDGGRLWMAKRNLVTATDGSALAAASAYAVGEDGCELHAGNYLELNAPTATLEDCVFAPGATATTGYVTVQGEQSVPFIFGRFVGIPQSAVRSTTAVQVGHPISMGKLRPLALCIHATEGWDPNSSDTIAIPISRTQDGNGEDCGNAAGNWGWLNFDGGPPGTNTLRDLIEHGYDENVSTGESIAPFPGFRGATESDWLALKGLEDPIHIVIFQHVDGCGNNARYTVLSFAAMEVLDVQFTGPPEEPPGDGPPGGGPPDNGPPGGGGCPGGSGGKEVHGYIYVRAATLLSSGECCGDSDIDFGARVMKICEVRPDEALIAANCTITN